MEECKHTNTEYDYGFAKSAGFRGIGVIEICIDCNKVISWSDDIQCNTTEEIEHNKQKLAELV